MSDGAVNLGFPEIDDGDDTEETTPDADEPNHTDPFDRVNTLDDVYLSDVMLPHSRPAHVDLAAASAYCTGGTYRAVSLARHRDAVGREITDRIAAFLDDDVCILLVRGDADADDNPGRAYYVTSRHHLPDVATTLCDDHGFVVSSVPSDYTGLPERLLPDDE